jgi:hypothetical protein
MNILGLLPTLVLRATGTEVLRTEVSRSPVPCDLDCLTVFSVPSTHRVHLSGRSSQKNDCLLQTFLASNKPNQTGQAPPLSIPGPFPGMIPLLCMLFVLLYQQEPLTRAGWKPMELVRVLSNFNFHFLKAKRVPLSLPAYTIIILWFQSVSVNEMGGKGGGGKAEGEAGA